MLGIYEKNIEIKSSAFQDVSDYGASVISNRKTINPPPASGGSTVPPPIQEVIFEEKEEIKPQPAKKPQGRIVVMQWRRNLRNRVGIG